MKTDVIVELGVIFRTSFVPLRLKERKRSDRITLPLFNNKLCKSTTYIQNIRAVSVSPADCSNC